MTRLSLLCRAIFARVALPSAATSLTFAASRMVDSNRSEASARPDTTQRAKPSTQPAKISIVVPVYNEESTVQELIGLVVRAPLPPNCTREIICVNDASTDGSKEKLDEL